MSQNEFILKFVSAMFLIFTALYFVVITIIPDDSVFIKECKTRCYPYRLVGWSKKDNTCTCDKTKEIK